MGKPKSQRSGATTVHATGERTHIIPLNAGKHAYVTVGNRIRHLSTTSPEFVEAIKELDASAKITSELETLATRYPDAGWDATLTRLRAEGAL